MFPSKHLSKQYLFKTWPCPSWDGLWAFVGFGLLGLGLGLGLYLLQRLTRKTLNVKANDLVLHYKKPPLVDSHHTPRVGENSPTNSESLHITKSVYFYNQKCKNKEYMT